MESTKGLTEIEILYEKFLKEKKLLANLSDLTIKSYRQAFDRWIKCMGKIMPTPQNVNTYVMCMRELELSPVTCNISIRSFNSFLSWWSEQGQPRFQIKQLRAEKKVMRTFSDTQLRDLLTWKPDTTKRNQTRIFVLMRFLIDTGARINEALTLEMKNVDFDNLLVTVRGKGNRFRTIPISIEMRKALYQYVNKYRQTTFQSPYVFCTSSGRVWSYQNARRELTIICDQIGIGIRDIDGFFHSFRRKFARNYIRYSGNVMYLMQVMGHSNINTTKGYVEANDEDLQDAHVKTSMLERLKGNLRR